jgi:tRNA-2-methylthio-N6-dimethylallyladenosine synthase
MSRAHNARDIGTICKVLIEGDSRKSAEEWKGRNDQNKMVVFGKKSGYEPGDYVHVLIESSTSATLIGTIV